MLLLEKQLKKKTILITMKLVLVYLCLLPTLKEKKHYFLKVILYCQQDWIDAMAVSYMLPAPCEQNPERHIFFFFFLSSGSIHWYSVILHSNTGYVLLFLSRFCSMRRNSLKFRSLLCDRVSTSVEFKIK